MNGLRLVNPACCQVGVVAGGELSLCSVLRLCWLRGTRLYLAERTECGRRLHGKSEWRCYSPRPGLQGLCSAHKAFCNNIRYCVDIVKTSLIRSSPKPTHRWRIKHSDHASALFDDTRLQSVCRHIALYVLDNYIIRSPLSFNGRKPQLQSHYCHSRHYFILGSQKDPFRLRSVSLKYSRIHTSAQLWLERFSVAAQPHQSRGRHQGLGWWSRLMCSSDKMPLVKMHSF